jgi:hypothetical protein
LTDALEGAGVKFTFERASDGDRLLRVLAVFFGGKDHWRHVLKRLLNGD